MSIAQPTATAVRLNGLEIVLDNRSGAIRRMSYPGPGDLLTAKSDEAGLVDAAYPRPDFEPLRLAARHSRGAVIEKMADRVVVRIGTLGPSRPGFRADGNVSAAITFRADPDGRSVVLSCNIENHSSRSLRQIVFPELRGLQAVAGPENTVLKTCGFGSAPFHELLLPESDQWYAVNSTTVEHHSGGMFHSMWARWLDLGGLSGGFSLFPKRWGWDPQVTTYVQLRQATKRLRILCTHADEVKPGEKWTSGEWVLTPHRSGWAKGIEPYRAWVRSHVKRRYAMPKHILEGLGFRTAWMCQYQPNDPTDVVWRFRDLPALADEAREHGLTEMVMWTWQPAFDASLPPPLPHLGTEEELLDAVKECRKRGVNLAPFISVIQASTKTAGRYGLQVTSNSGWTYHTEMLPRWNPPYASGLACVQVGPNNQKWQDEVAQAAARWADKGITSLCWDQYMTIQTGPSIQDLTKRIRDFARKIDPESTFSGEELWNVEIDSEWLDYTWDWGGYADRQAFVNAFPAPRPNANINRSESEAKLAFMDNLFLNVWPSKPDGINGSERIARIPALSRTLKRCSALRKRFLPYFTQGTLIGDCLLTKPSHGVRMSAYVLPDRVLALILDQGPAGSLSCHYDLGPWLPNAGRVKVSHFDEDGRLISSSSALRSGMAKTGNLKKLQIEVLEFRATPRS